VTCVSLTIRPPAPRRPHVTFATGPARGGAPDRGRRDMCARTSATLPDLLLLVGNLGWTESSSSSGSRRVCSPKSMRACRQLAARGMMVPQGGPQPHRQCRRADRRSKRPSRHSPVGHPRTGGPRRGRSIASPATTMARPEKGISPHSRPASGTKPWHGRGGTKHGLPGIPESRRRATQQNDPLVPFAARGRS